MRFLLKLILFIAIFASASWYYLKTINNERSSVLEDILNPRLPSLPIIEKKIFPSSTSNKKSNSSDTFQAYKWTDKNGVVHYSEKKTPGQESELTELKGISILPAK